MLQNSHHSNIADQIIGRAGTSANTKPQIAPTEHKNVFQVILDKLDPNFDYRAAANIAADENLNNKILVVATVAEVLRVAQSLDLGLCKLADFVYLFNGGFWKVAEKEKIEQFLGHAALKMGVNLIDAQYFKFREQLLKQFLAVAHLPLPETTDDVVINLQNGTFEITKTGRKLREFRRADFLTYQLPFAFDEAAKCEKWFAFLNKVLPDKTAQAVLAEFIGYVFTRNLKLEVALVLFGGGHNGKSVVHDVFNALLGRDSVSNYSLKNLSEEHCRAQIVNKLLNYSSEINSKIETDIFKQLVSGEPVQARLKYGQSFIAERYAKLMFNANQLPSEVEHTEAYFRRFLILPFEVKITDQEKNPNLAKEIIAGELSGVFNWVLLGLDRLLRQQKFSECLAAKQLLNQFRIESDSTAMFVNEECIKGGKSSLSDLYFAYKGFCADDGYRALGKQKFGKRLETNGISRTDSDRPFFALTLKSEVRK